jgi:O-antigen ligase
VDWLSGPRPEGLVLGLVLIGYIIGNRGFAQATPFGSAPIFFGELGLGFALGLTIVRGAIARRVPFEVDWINRAVLLWIAIGSIRVWHDFRIYGASALRDYATIYYAGYFFAAQAAAQHARSANWIRNCMVIASAALPLVSLLYNLFKDFFLTTLVWRGVPLIFQKDDLVATFLFAAGFFLMSTPVGRRGWIVPIGAIACLFSGLAWLSRAAMVALLTVSGGWAWGRRWRPLKLLAAAGAIGMVVVVAEAVFGNDRFTDTRAYAVYEHFVSIFDVSGSRVYRNADTADSGDNNRFRAVWWRTVANETIRENPWFGLGFGHDLAEAFLLNYGLRADDTFSARSPHSIVFTMFGRLGLVGLIALTLLAISMAAAFHRIISSLRDLPSTARTPSAGLEALGWFSVAWVIFISALFGVVLEGPMGAVVFWISLGMGNAKRREWDELREAPAAEALAAESAENAVTLPPFAR